MTLMIVGQCDDPFHSCSSSCPQRHAEKAFRAAWHQLSHSSCAKVRKLRRKRESETKQWELINERHDWNRTAIQSFLPDHSFSSCGSNSSANCQPASQKWQAFWHKLSQQVILTIFGTGIRGLSDINTNTIWLWHIYRTTGKHKTQVMGQSRWIEGVLLPTNLPWILHQLPFCLGQLCAQIHPARAAWGIEPPWHHLPQDSFWKLNLDAADKNRIN